MTKCNMLIGRLRSQCWQSATEFKVQLPLERGIQTEARATSSVAKAQVAMAKSLALKPVIRRFFETNSKTQKTRGALRQCSKAMATRANCSGELRHQVFVLSSPITVNIDTVYVNIYIILYI